MEVMVWIVIKRMIFGLDGGYGRGSSDCERHVAWFWLNLFDLNESVYIQIEPPN